MDAQPPGFYIFSVYIITRSMYCHNLWHMQNLRCWQLIFPKNFKRLGTLTQVNISLNILFQGIKCAALCLRTHYDRMSARNIIKKSQCHSLHRPARVVDANIQNFWNWCIVAFKYRFECQEAKVTLVSGN